MTPEQLRAAAEYFTNRPSCECDPEVGVTNCIGCDIDMMARHILATVHPDDDEPVTVEWLRSDCGFYGDDLITHKWITTNFRLYFVDKIARGVVMYTGGDTHYKTRGQVRILLKALNVEVK